MPRSKMSNSDVERLLCGKLPEDTALTPLVPMVSAFRNIRWPAPPDKAVVRVAREAAAIARSVSPRATPKPKPTARRRQFAARAVQRGLATGLATVMLVSGLAGVAVASDDAAPGDFLYSIDRALESVGVGDGGATERISEAWALFERGEVAEALGHASQALDVDSGGEMTEQTSARAAATDSLRSAAGNVGTTNGWAASPEVRAAVAAMLTEMAAMLEDPAVHGTAFGQSVAEMARLLGGNANPLDPEPELDHTGPGNSNQASTPPGKAAPGPAGDPPTTPEDPPANSDKKPVKTDSSQGKSDGNQANPKSP